MEKNGVFVIFALIFFVSMTFVSAEVTFCAERTTSGAWCQNVPQNQVNTGINPTTGQQYRNAPTSCDATSFCKLGTCVDSNRGSCSPNVPQQVCQNNGGVWVLGKPEEIPQCTLGCCLLGDQAAFTTQTACKALSSDYGIETNYRTDIVDEILCIESANPDVDGACVLDDGFSRGCKRLTRGECQKLDTGINNLTIEFHEGLLCSAESLATKCGPTSSKPKTTCVANKDQVYFVDTCGNLANVYDSTKVNSQEYWTDIKDEAESCDAGNGNAGSKTCGNCDYLLGSTCRAVEAGNSATPKPSYGNFVCADLSCKYQGKNYRHGETWCAGTQGINQSLPGSGATRLVCYSGEVTSEPCATFRGEICAEDSTSTSQGIFRSGQCRVNIWQDCTEQKNKAECEDVEQRDCRWIEGQGLKDTEGNVLLLNSEGNLVPSTEPNTGKGAACLPKYAPGFDFWNEESEAETLCATASDNCIVKFENKITDGRSYKCKENCECLGLQKGDDFAKASDVRNSPWAKAHNTMCVALGDCGDKKNYVGAQGYHNFSATIVVREVKK